MSVDWSTVPTLDWDPDRVSEWMDSRREQAHDTDFAADMAVALTEVEDTVLLLVTALAVWRDRAAVTAQHGVTEDALKGALEAMVADARTTGLVRGCTEAEAACGLPDGFLLGCMQQVLGP